MIILYHSKENCFERWTLQWFKIIKQHCYMNIETGEITWKNTFIC